MGTYIVTDQDLFCYDSDVIQSVNAASENWH